MEGDREVISYETILYLSTPTPLKWASLAHIKEIATLHVL